MFDKFIYVLGDASRGVPKVLVMFALLSIFDLIGLSMIGPLLNLVVSPESNPPEFIQRLFDRENSLATTSDLIKAIGLALICVFVLKALASVYIAHKVILFSQNQQAELRKRLVSKYQSLDLNQLRNKDSNHYINVIQNHCSNFAALTNLLLQNIGDLIVSIAIIGFLVWVNPIAFFLIVALMGPVLVLFNSLTREVLKKNGQGANAASKGIIQHLREILAGFKEIRILGCEKYFQNKFSQKVDAFKFTQVTILFLPLLPRYIIETLVIVFVALLALSTIYFEPIRESLVTTLGLFGVAALRLLPFARNLSTVLNKLHFFSDTVEQLFADLHLLPSGTVRPFVSKPISTGNTNWFKELAIEDLSFAYADSPAPILNRVSIQIRRGESIGIMGESGAGKTTLVNAMLGFLKPCSGQVLLNGENVTGDSYRLWEMAAYLPQELFLVDATIKENVALGVHVDEIDSQLLQKALSVAQLDELVSGLSDGVNTMIGENGLSISGGQRQRIALARAIYFKKNLLVLDEATSNLDIKTEAQVVDQIHEIGDDVAAVYISHRMSTLKHCGRIFAIERGTLKRIR
jgi:ABC-type multidrug transport system fused ATPase/permease subunit